MQTVRMRSSDKPRSRGKGKKPAMAHVNVRIPKPTLEWFREQPNCSAVMRKALVEYVQQHTTEKE